MSFLAPSAPAPPTAPPPPPAPPMLADSSVKASGAAARAAAAGGMGFGDTIKSSVDGAPKVPTAKKELLGS